MVLVLMDSDPLCMRLESSRRCPRRQRRYTLPHCLTGLLIPDDFFSFRNQPSQKTYKNLPRLLAIRPLGFHVHLLEDVEVEISVAGTLLSPQELEAIGLVAPKTWR